MENQYLKNTLELLLKPIPAGLLVFLILLFVATNFTYQRIKINEKVEKLELKEAALNAKDRIQNILEDCEQGAKTLSLIIKHYGTELEFDHIAAEIINSSSYIDAIGLIQGDTVKYIYPLSGNEEALGHNILEDPKVRKGAFEAIESKKIFFAGPYELKQGGKGIVGRLPLFINGKYYGFAMTLIRLPKLIEHSDLSENKKSLFHYQLVWKNQETGKEEYILPVPDKFSHAAFESALVPESSIRVEVRHSDLHKSPVSRINYVWGTLFSLLGGFLMWFVRKQPILLRKSIEEKTKSLELSEERYFNLFEQADDAIMVTDFSGRFIDVNASMCDKIGYSKKELLEMNMFDILDPDELKRDPMRTDLIVEGVHLIRNRKVLRRDGSKTEVEINVRRISGDRILAIARDLTDLRAAQKQIALNESTLQAAFESSAIGMAIISLEGNWIKVNRGLIQMLGYSEEELLTMSFKDLTHPDDLELDMHFIKKALAGDLDSFNRTKRYIHKNGNILWINLNVALVRNAQKQPEFFISQVENITERIEMEKQILREKNLSDTVIDAMPGILFVADKDMNMIRWNKSIEEFSGYSNSDLTGKKTIDFVMPNEIQKAIDQRTEAFKNGKAQGEYNLITKDGRYLTYLIINMPIMYMDELCTLGIGVDISDKKEAENELIKKNLEIKERNKELSCLFKVTQLANNPMLSKEEILKASIEVIPPAWQYPDITCVRILFNGEEYLSPDFRESEWSQSTDIIVNNEKQGSIEVFYMEKRPTEQEGPFLIEERSLINTLGDIVGTAMERKTARELVQKSEQRYRYLFDNSPGLIMIWDLDDMKILEVNNPAMELYGYTRDELIGMSVLKFRPIGEKDDPKEFAKKLTENDEIKERRIWKHLKKNGESMYLDITAHRINYKGHKAVLSLSKDVTEQVKTENKLKKAYENIRYLNSHMERIREDERKKFSRELHDELGQQLTVLKLYTSLLEDLIPEENVEAIKRTDELTGMIDESIRTVRRISSELHPRILDDLGLVEALRWQSEEFEKRTGIECAVNIPDGIVNLDKDTSASVFRIFQESLTNILRHAEANKIIISLKSDKNEWILSIKDNGKGFEEKSMRKYSLGTMGMKERASMIGGKLLIKSKLGEGTEVKLIMPLG